MFINLGIVPLVSQFPAILCGPVRSNSMYATVAAQMQTDQDFEDLYRAHYRRIFSLCRYLLNSFDAAEDATHEVFLRARRGIDTYDPALPFSTWLSGIASHYCIDVLRRRGTEKRIFGHAEAEPLEPQSQGPSPLGEMLAAERSSEVRHAVAALSEKFRVPLVLAYYNELSYDEISKILGLNRNHVATLIFRAKQQLRRNLAYRQVQEG